MNDTALGTHLWFASFHPATVFNTKSNNFSTSLQLLKILKSEQKLTFLVSPRQALGYWTKVWGKLTWDEERNMQGGEGLRD